MKGSPASFSIFDPALYEHIPLVRDALLADCAHTPLFEIFEIFGTRVGLRFLEVFSGVTIEIPDKGLVAKSIRRAILVGEIEKRGGVENAAALRSVGMRYRAEEKELRAACRRLAFVRDVKKVLLARG